MKNETRLAILDGFATLPRGIPLSSLYHRRLAAELRLRYGLRLKVLLDQHEIEGGYGERIHRLVAREACDTVLLHISARPYIDRCQALWRGEEPLAPESLHAEAGAAVNAEPLSNFEPNSAQGTRRSIWRLHPAIPLPRFFFCENALDATTGGREPRYSRWRSMNLLLGEALGLDHWARWEEARHLDSARTECRKAGLRLIVMGPMPIATIRSRIEHRLLGKLAGYLARAVPRMGLEFLDCFWDSTVDPCGNPLLAEDGWHLNALGHAHLARQLAEVWGNERVSRGDLFMSLESARSRIGHTRPFRRVDWN